VALTHEVLYLDAITEAHQEAPWMRRKAGLDHRIGHRFPGEVLCLSRASSGVVDTISPGRVRWTGEYELA